MAYALTPFLPPPNWTPRFVMSSNELCGVLSPKELEKRIRECLLAVIHTLYGLHLHLSYYYLQHGENSNHDPFGGNDLDGVYTIYEEWVDSCQREWMNLRVASEKQASLLGAPGDSPRSRSCLDLERSSSPSKHYSALEEDETAEIGRGVALQLRTLMRLSRIQMFRPRRHLWLIRPIPNLDPRCAHPSPESLLVLPFP